MERVALAWIAGGTFLAALSVTGLAGCDTGADFMLVNQEDNQGESGFVLREFEPESAFATFMEKRQLYLKTVDKHERPSLKPLLSANEWARAKRNRETFFFSLPGQSIPVLERSVGVGPHDQQQKMAEALLFFPEITSMTVDTDVSQSLVQAWSELPRLREFWYRSDIPLPVSHAKVLGNHPTVRELILWCTVSDDAFERLGVSVSIEDITVADASPSCFRSLAQMPRLQHIRYGEDPSLTHLLPVGFRESIDDETQRAVESLDGRLKTFSTSGEAAIHWSIFRSISSIQSLTTLRVRGGIWGEPLTLADFERLKALSNLEHFSLDYGFEGWTEEERSAAEKILLTVKRNAAARAERGKGAAVNGTLGCRQPSRRRLKSY